MARITFYTFGILSEPKGDQQVQGFFDRIEASFDQAERSQGFIDRDRRSDMAEGWGPHASPRFFDEDKHAGAPATLSLWTDLESVRTFAYRATHGEAFQSRREWFLKPEWPTYVAWWVDDDHTPTREEACQRHEHIDDHGPSAYAFNFKQSFDEDGKSIELNRDLLDVRIQANANPRPS